MNGTERNILAFAYAKRVVCLFTRPSPEDVPQYCVRAPTAVVHGIYAQAACIYPDSLVNRMRPDFGMETDANAYSYIFYDRLNRNWLGATAIAAIALWRHRTQKDLDAEDCPTVGELTAVILAGGEFPPGGSPLANAARIVTIVQRQWRDKNRRRVAPAGERRSPHDH